MLLRPDLVHFWRMHLNKLDNVVAKQSRHNRLRRNTAHFLGGQQTLLVSATCFLEFRAIGEPTSTQRTR